MQLTPPPILQVAHTSISGDLLATPCDCLVVGIAEGDLITSAAQQIDQRLNGWLTKSIASGAIKAKRGDLLLIPKTPGLEVNEGTGPTSILFVGVGNASQLDRSKAYELGAIIVRRLIDVPRQRIIISLDGLVDEGLQESLVTGALTGCDGQSLYFSEPKLHAPKEIAWVGFSDASIQTGVVLGESINLTRRLVNEPPNVMYPESFANTAAAVADQVGLGIEVWDEKRLETEGCRAILAVGAGSSRPPRLVILRHQGGPASDAPVAMVGKGVTFDSGGLSIKPTEGMVDMKCDMAGAATMLGAMSAIKRLNLPINVIGVCGLAENMISGDSFKLGDVIEARNGTTIEILNTDAEGRVVLADTLDVAVQHKVSAIVDLATLTGACMVALGRDTAGLMTNNEMLCDEVTAAAKQEGELVWQLPMFDLFDEHIKSKIADIKNTGDARWGGAITAAKFLERFVDAVPWVHVDIAGPAYAESPKPFRDAGATGVMLRTLVRWLQTRAAGKPE
jgi:leucyl aminopeptidase